MFNHASWPRPMSSLGQQSIRRFAKRILVREKSRPRTKCAGWIFWSVFSHPAKICKNMVPTQQAICANGREAKELGLSKICCTISSDLELPLEVSFLSTP